MIHSNHKNLFKVSPLVPIESIDDIDGNFVSVIKEAVVDLKNVKLEIEMCNCNVVSEIESPSHLSFHCGMIV